MWCLARGVWNLNSEIRDPSLAPAGRAKIDWAMRFMPVLLHWRKEHELKKSLQGQRVAISLHVEAKTAFLAECIRAAGAEVAIAGCNPLSTQDDVAAALADAGIAVFAWHGATEEEYNHFLNRLADFQPTMIIDDGGDLVHLLHTERQECLSSIFGGCEETTTGIQRLRAMHRDGKLDIPMLAVNDARMKYLFDNRYGTGQSVWDGIMRTTNRLVAGACVVVLGYGWCGRGVAMRAKGLGARVIVCEVDPIAANEALLDGFDVMPALDAAAIGDFFITVTSNHSVLRKEHFLRMKDGAILANAGHFDVEIDLKSLSDVVSSVRPLRENITEYLISDDKKIYVLADGRLVNLAAGSGHPIEIMDLSFSLQAEGLIYLLQHSSRLGKGVWELPAEIDRRVAERRLQSLGVRIDQLSDSQQQYLQSW